MRLRSAGLALLAAAAVTGCGSVSASLRDLRHDAGLACRHTNRSFMHLPALPAQNQTVSFLSTGIGRLTTQLAKLGHLTPPRDVADIYRAALSALEQELAMLRATVRAIGRGQDPATAFKTLDNQIAPLEGQVNNAWQALQIPACLQ